MHGDRPEGRLELAVEPGSDWTVVRLTGELDYGTEPRFEACIDQLIEDERVRIAVELSALEFCDSGCVGGFVTALKRVRQAGGDLILLRPNGRVRRLLDITGLHRFIPTTDALPGAGSSDDHPV